MKKLLCYWDQKEFVNVEILKMENFDMLISNPKLLLFNFSFVEKKKAPENRNMFEKY